MIYQNILAFIACLLIFLLGFILNGNVSLYFNIYGFLVVVGGTAAAAILSYGLTKIKIAFLVTKRSYSSAVTSEKEVINILMDLSIRSRVKGVFGLQDKEDEITTTFLQHALACVVDGFKPDQTRDVLLSEMNFYKIRRVEIERILRSIGNYLPTFGIIGSVIGLISLLAGVGDSNVILAAIPIALTSTLYGVALANLVFIPFAENIRERTKHELLLQKIIIDGMYAIQTETDPKVIKTKLLSFLTPADREDKMVSYSDIIKLFRAEMKKSENTDKKQ